jgi:hypothetical protein
VLHTTDLTETSSCVIWWYLPAWCCGVPAAIATCFGVSAQGGGATWHHNGVGGWCGKNLHIDLHTEMGCWKIAEMATSGASALAPLHGYVGRICARWCYFSGFGLYDP